MSIVRAFDEKIMKIEASTSEIEASTSEIEDLRQSVEALKLQKHCEEEKKENMIVFSAYINKGTIKEGNYVTFSDFFTNHGNAFDLETGTFKAPSKGVYEFSFFTMYHFAYFRCSKVAVEVNGRKITSFFAYRDNPEDGHTATLSHGWIIDLNQGDILRLKVTEGRIFTYEDSYTSFNGKCIKIL